MAIDLARDTRTVSVINEQAKPEAADKPSRVEKIAAALREIEEKGSFPDCVTKVPGAFLWEFYKAWVNNGGQDSGKNRNSIRRMRDHWLSGDQEVKSLHPKLTGKVRISKDDAKSLMTLFLGRWKFAGVKEGDWVLTPDGYAPFPCRDCEKLCEMLVDAMYPAGSDQARIGLQLPARSSDHQLEGIQNNWSAVANLYRTSDAVINFSRHKAALGETPAETMRFFWHLFKNFYDTMKDKNPIFIWIIDIGGRQAEDEEAWAEFFNFEMLKAQFRSFATFDSADDDESDQNDAELKEGQNSGIRDAFLRSLTIPGESHREKRWKWLCDHAVIIIQNLHQEEFRELYREEDEGIDKIRLKDIGVTAENILPKMLPHIWEQNRRFRGLYGSNIDVADATLTAFFKQDGWDEVTSGSGEVNDVRYFAHALTPKYSSSGNTDLGSVTISREIDSPGEFYDEAFRIVYWASRRRLMRQSELGGGGEADWAIAIAYLRKQGFQILRLQEFLSIHKSP
ncbi:MAG: hypothetical protein ACRBM6_17200 [Geminicoccales bacterium]